MSTEQKEIRSNWERGYLNILSEPDCARPKKLVGVAIGTTDVKPYQTWSVGRISGIGHHNQVFQDEQKYCSSSLEPSFQYLPPPCVHCESPSWSSQLMHSRKEVPKYRTDDMEACIPRDEEANRVEFTGDDIRGHVRAQVVANFPCSSKSVLPARDGQTVLGMKNGKKVVTSATLADCEYDSASLQGKTRGVAHLVWV
jgi:hypothetical protein